MTDVRLREREARDTDERGGEAGAARTAGGGESCLAGSWIVSCKVAVRQATTDLPARIDIIPREYVRRKQLSGCSPAWADQPDAEPLAVQ